ncbi:MAG: DUF2975 domain-containing protein [Patescibacteria group bacterium]
MRRRSTNFLRFIIFILGAGVLALGLFALPSVWRGGSAEFPEASQALLLIILGLYATAIPFFIALWQALKLLRYLDQGTAFSTLSAEALNKIKRCAVVIAVLYVGGVPLLFPIAETDDAPGLVVIGMAIALAPITVAVFTTILERLLQTTLDQKSKEG